MCINYKKIVKILLVLSFIVFSWLINVFAQEWSEWWGNCENPINPEWTCGYWYEIQGNCCIKIVNTCTWNNEYWTLSWSSYICHSCKTWEEIANPDHSRCICDINWKKCCWVKLNTIVPFIWDCIEIQENGMLWNGLNSDKLVVNQYSAFPILIQWLMKILMSLVLIFSFLMIIIAWLLMTSWAFSKKSYDKWKDIIRKVVISLILLWCSWLILSLINPSFFGW